MIIRIKWVCFGIFMNIVVARAPYDAASEISQPIIISQPPLQDYAGDRHGTRAGVFHRESLRS
jgi:hypothetical protein